MSAAYSIDVTFAYARLGLDAGASLEQIEKVLANARAYRFSTRERLKQLEHFVKFFAMRGQFGELQDSFIDIRKSYYKQALAFHPDRNSGNARAEEHLKGINAAYALVTHVHREAKDYYHFNDAVRRELEAEARRAREQEAPPLPPEWKEPPPKPAAEERQSSFTRKTEWAGSTGFAAAVGGKRYMAASIPRFVRTARLSHLPLNRVIGCWFIKRKDDINLVYDVIMLPEREFMRARAHLGTPNVMNPTLQRGGLTPSYIPQDTKVVMIPPGESDPEAFAKKYFRHEFAAEHKIWT